VFYFGVVTKRTVPAIDGFFTMDFEQPRLLGSRCKRCGNYAFPPEQTFCKNPSCDGDEFETVELSARGKLWSYSHNGYKPPAPYVCPTEEFEPYAVAAVELEEEKMVVMGMVPRPFDHTHLTVGQEMELVLDTLFETEEERVVVWKWRPVQAAS
jgi:uncharacterized protein